MRVALLFDAFGYEDHWNYWWATRDLVFSTGIIQSSGRHMQLSIGDVHVGFNRGDDPEALYYVLFLHNEWRQLHDERLQRTFVRSVVFAMVFENMPRQLAEELHAVMSPEPGYLGAVEVNFEFGPHLARYRVPEKYRLSGTYCRAFVSMGEDDGKDEDDLEEMRRLGYVDVDWEDRGAHQTIFDDFDTPRHFERVAAFRRAIFPLLPGGEDAAFELVMVLSDLNPKLFNALGSAVERLMSAETEEEVAQAALSGRRYMEQLADVLFPARKAKRNGRSVGKAAYRNRLWAFVEDNVAGDTVRREALGREIDRLVEELNGGLHSDKPQERVLKAFADAAQLTTELLALNPEEVRKPYYAFNDRIVEFLRESISLRGEPAESGDNPK
jgi:hypothetical protein